MAQEIIHDERYCACVKYKPELPLYGVKFNGINYKCKTCGRYVDPKKWKGGIIKFTNRSRYAKPNQCPCCGKKMAKHRKAKKKFTDSLLHQLDFPELHNAKSQKQLQIKINLIQQGRIIPTVQ